MRDGIFYGLIVFIFIMILLVILGVSTWFGDEGFSLSEEEVRSIVQEELAKAQPIIQEPVHIAPKIIYPDESESVKILVENSECWTDYPEQPGVSVRKEWKLKDWNEQVYTGTIRFEERRTTKIINETIKQVTVDMNEREVTC